MKKEQVCEYCHGKGKIEIKVCDDCGSEYGVGKYNDNGKEKEICQNCWAKTLTDEEIANL